MFPRDEVEIFPCQMFQFAKLCELTVFIRVTEHVTLPKFEDAE